MRGMQCELFAPIPRPSAAYFFHLAFYLMKHLFLFLPLTLLLGCQSTPAEQPATKTESGRQPAEVIREAIAYHGAYDSAQVSFRFRDRDYEAKWQAGAFEYVRAFEENGQAVKDVLSNEGFRRFVDGQEVALSDSLAGLYTSSVNSVWYFALLPYRLADPAVVLEDLGTASIAGVSYRKIGVTFREEGGGEDHDDKFVYWFDAADRSMDYLAYSYAETDGLGLRFRAARNPRRVGGILFQDYVNYKADPAQWQLPDLDKAFEAGQLDSLSFIGLENISAGRLEAR